MRAVNLLPRDRTSVQRNSALAGVVREPLLPLSIATLVLAVGGVGLAAHSAGSTVSSRTAQARQLDQQLAAAASAQRQHTTSSGPSRASAAGTLTAQRTSWDGFLSTLSHVVPEDVWMLSLSAQGSQAGAATPASTDPQASAGSVSPTGFSVTGYTYSQPSVARMMRRLALLPWLRDVSLVTSTKTAIANHTVYQFTVGANFIGIPAVGT
jgi:Tfp pilus assembly protein PilN